MDLDVSFINASTDPRRRHILRGIDWNGALINGMG